VIVILEPTDQAKAAIGKRVSVVGGVPTGHGLLFNLE
jgi:hypothetical protein